MTAFLDRLYWQNKLSCHVYKQSTNKMHLTQAFNPHNCNTSDSKIKDPIQGTLHKN